MFTVDFLLFCFFINISSVVCVDLFLTMVLRLPDSVEDLNKHSRQEIKIIIFSGAVYCRIAVQL